jgi:hypothetical protein
MKYLVSIIKTSQNTYTGVPRDQAYNRDKDGSDAILVALLVVFVSYFLLIKHLEWSVEKKRNK